MNEKITFHQLVDKLSELTGGTQSTSELFVKEFFATITDALKKDGNVKIKNFGTFILSDIDGDNIVKFEPDKEIAEAINMPFSCFEAVELNDEVTDEILNAQEHNEFSSENVNVTTDGEIEMSDIEQPVADDELCAAEPEQDDCTEVDTDGSPLSSADNDDNTPDSIPEFAPMEEETEICEQEYVPDDSSQEPSRKMSWAIAVICLILGLIIGYCVYPIMNNNKELNDNSLGIAIADTIGNSVDDTLALLVEDSAKIVVDYDSTCIAKSIVVYDTISRNRFLTTMSREYYGRMEFWVYIYEENKANLGNPNRIKPGTAIVIPPVEKYGIDKNNPDCVEKAKLKAMEIYAPYEK